MDSHKSYHITELSKALARCARTKKCNDERAERAGQRNQGSDEGPTPPGPVPSPANRAREDKVWSADAAAMLAPAPLAAEAATASLTDGVIVEEEEGACVAVPCAKT